MEAALNLDFQESIQNSAVRLENCLKRIDEVFAGKTENFWSDEFRQESILLNLQRACKHLIDLAKQAVIELKLEMPKSKQESFEILKRAGFVSNEVSEKMDSLVRFYNKLIYQHSKIDKERVFKMIENDLPDFKEFSKQILKVVN